MDESVILLVEDNPDDIALTKRAFKKSNLKNTLVVASDGVEALDYIFARGAYAERDINNQPVLILLDLKLPKLDGLEVLEILRSDPRTEFIPVVVLTSSNEQEDLVRSYRLRANSYVRKPVDFSEFVEAVQHLGLYWLVLNESPQS